MIKRIVTYDVKDGNDYTDFYEIVDKYDAEELTESTYVFNTSLSQEEFESLLAKVFSRGDLVFMISVNSSTHKLFYKKITI